MNDNNYSLNIGQIEDKYNYKYDKMYLYRILDMICYKVIKRGELIDKENYLKTLERFISIKDLKNKKLEVKT